MRARIAEACRAAGRGASEVTLIAVTKGFPAADAAALAVLGVRDMGEARDQEARAKLAGWPAADAAPPPPRWHMIGRLQSNKARSVAGWASLVHGVDRPALVDALAGGADRDGRTGPLEVLLQLSLDGDPARGGARWDRLEPLAARVAAAAALRLRGLMVVAPAGADPRAAFEAAARAAAALRAQHPGADLLSAGMTGDFEAAIAAGATHVRVGTALLGDRSAKV
ncbi:MAG: YggS family pyridoxal phosphate-dependent enzyme [Frankiaceae bacterium]|nr:YggS family pyridoxal phosphate-dependent enzyme [Frankiaceae bacterium]